MSAIETPRKANELEFGIHRGGEFGTCYFIRPIGADNFDEHLEIDYLFPESLQADEPEECTFLFKADEAFVGQDVTSELIELGFVHNIDLDSRDEILVCN